MSKHSCIFEWVRYDNVRSTGRVYSTGIREYATMCPKLYIKVGQVCLSSLVQTDQRGVCHIIGSSIEKSSNMDTLTIRCHSLPKVRADELGWPPINEALRLCIYYGTRRKAAKWCQ